MDVIKIVRSILRTPCRSVEIVPFDAEDYQRVIQLWVRFKRLEGRQSKVDRLLRGVVSINSAILLNDFFSFHLSQDNHILLYSSKLLDNILLMASVGGRYLNIKIPRTENLRNRSSFVAVFTRDQN